MLLILLDHSGVHRGLTADTIGKITATDPTRTDQALATMAAQREAHCAGELWYIDPIYAEKNLTKFIPAKDIKEAPAPTVE
ncbi:MULTISPECIES: hypothetical protein [unclassified Bradyrhizobium]|uniref:hypothetical protein n=1 Tax=unclassified Bradyrhizobium TaxID=2631580 RepID=UPI0033920A2F